VSGTTDEDVGSIPATMAKTVIPNSVLYSIFVVFFVIF
jgi:hypothetical protein